MVVEASVFVAMAPQSSLTKILQTQASVLMLVKTVALGQIFIHGRMATPMQDTETCTITNQVSAQSRVASASQFSKFFVRKTRQSTLDGHPPNVPTERTVAAMGGGTKC